MGTLADPSGSSTLIYCAHTLICCYISSNQLGVDLISA